MDKKRTDENFDEIMDRLFDPDGTLAARGWTVSEMSQICKEWPPPESFFRRSREFKRIQAEANRKRAEAAREQHEVSNPRAGEIKPVLVLQQSVVAPDDHRKGQTTRAAAAKVNKGAVKRKEPRK